MAPMWAAQAAVAISVMQISSAMRPDGNRMRVLSTYGGAPRIIRFW